MLTVNTVFSNCIKFAPTCERQAGLEDLLQLFRSGAAIVVVVDRQQYPVGAIYSHRLIDYLAQALVFAPVGIKEIDRERLLTASIVSLIEPVEVVNAESILQKLTDIASDTAKSHARLYTLVDERQKFIGLLDDRCLLDTVKTLDSTSHLPIDEALNSSFPRNNSLPQPHDRQAIGQYLKQSQHNVFLRPTGLKNDSKQFREFLIWLAHELKSPLTAIVGLSSLLKELTPERVESKYFHYGDLIYRSGRRLMDLVNELFDLNSLDEATIEKFNEPRVEKNTTGTKIDKSWKILRLHPQENEFERDEFDIALNNFLSGLQHRILEADSIEQAELLARVWRVDAIVLNGSYCSDPSFYLKAFSRSDYLCAIPLVTLDAKTTEAAKNIPDLAVFPYLLPLQEQYLNDILQAIEIATG